MENVALWHERDISHSSVERGIGPDATIHLDFALHRMAGVIEKLVVYPENMARNLALLGGLHNSQRVMLALTQAGVAREDAYRLVQQQRDGGVAKPAARAPNALLDQLRADARRHRQTRRQSARRLLRRRASFRPRGRDFHARVLGGARLDRRARREPRDGR